ncbi:MAG: sulfite exporter TauE/SafE family protein [Pseudomonadota bacterium]|nr:sulfite exporter TauE/SafE family protein [Pseudomonadota bacterium]
MELPPAALTEDFLIYLAIGFAAQMIDGALGMAYGVTASSLLLALGIPPAVSSATVHAAECFTTGTSALSHHAFGNIDRRLFKRLLLPGVIGAAAGAYLLTSLPGDALKPWIAVYLLLIGIVLVVKAFRVFPPREVTTHLTPLGFFGALIDAIGGGGWGPIVASNLLARGNEFRLTVGTVNAVEFFVTLTASIVFLLTIGLGHWPIILGLALGGVLAAPLGAWIIRIVKPRPMLCVVGLLVIGLSVRTLLKHFNAI